MFQFGSEFYFKMDKMFQFGSKLNFNRSGQNLF